MPREVFYDARQVAILPMGFCYPGTGASGDLPPRPECATRWRRRVLDALPNVRLTLAVGQHALAWHLGSKAPVDALVSGWREGLARGLLPLVRGRGAAGVARGRGPGAQADTAFAAVTSLRRTCRRGSPSHAGVSVASSSGRRPSARSAPT
jgi:hypothetical protein